FPLVAKSGGVLMRSGHTEAAVDLCRLAGLHPVGVICELVNDDGTVKRGPENLAFAREHGLKIISVADLIAYRQSRERLVEQEKSFDVATPIGMARGISYATPFDSVRHLALIFGDISGGKDVPVRLHREDVVADVFGGPQALGGVYDVFKREGRGILVYLREGTAGVPAGEMGQERSESAATRAEIWRDVGLGAQILRDLNVHSIRLITASNRHYVGLSGFGIEISDTIRIETC
ncbi:MAG: 3,4-dihydroxy-2-butanone-4-phosphate synthase, partial [Rhizobiales bacterium]|nr:3,4-dihydroxy-2-butanone-4-phosphate synthase [Hyphomicrobiales bacterium]